MVIIGVRSRLLAGGHIPFCSVQMPKGDKVLYHLTGRTKDLVAVLADAYIEALLGSCTVKE
jgi:hypothetical protein